MSTSSPYLVAMATEPPSTPEYEENIFFACSGGSNSKKIGSYSPNSVTRVEKYKTTCLGPHIARTNTYNSPEGHHLPGWLPWQPILS